MRQGPRRYTKHSVQLRRRNGLRPSFLGVDETSCTDGALYESVPVPDLISYVIRV
jgi:hypothetical protein